MFRHRAMEKTLWLLDECLHLSAHYHCRALSTCRSVMERWREGEREKDGVMDA